MHMLFDILCHVQPCWPYSGRLLLINWTLQQLYDGRCIWCLTAPTPVSPKCCCPARKSDHTTPLLCELHWLKVPERVKFRLCVLTYRCLDGTVPHYLLLRPSVHSLAVSSPRSTEMSTLLVPSTRRSTLGDRSFRWWSSWSSIAAGVSSSVVQLSGGGRLERLDSVDVVVHSLKSWLVNAHQLIGQQQQYCNHSLSCLSVCILCFCFSYCIYVVLLSAQWGGSNGIEAQSLGPLFLQCFDAVGWVFWPIKPVPDMTYNVFGGTLNLAQFQFPGAYRGLSSSDRDGS